MYCRGEASAPTHTSQRERAIERERERRAGPTARRKEVSASVRRAAYDTSVPPPVTPCPSPAPAREAEEEARRAREMLLRSLCRLSRWSGLDGCVWSDPHVCESDPPVCESSELPLSPSSSSSSAPSFKPRPMFHACPYAYVKSKDHVS